MHPAYARISYVADFREMVAADPSLFKTPGGLQRKVAQVVVAALLASEEKIRFPQNPRVLEPEGEGGSARGPRQRDKQPTRFNLGSNLQERDQVRVLAMLDDIVDRFAFSLEDIKPHDFTGEPMRINLNSDQSIFRPPHKLGQVEWDFVKAQCKKLETLGFIQRSTQSSYASARKMQKETTRIFDNAITTAP